MLLHIHKALSSLNPSTMSHNTPMHKAAAELFGTLYMKKANVPTYGWIGEKAFAHYHTHPLHPAFMSFMLNHADGKRSISLTIDHYGNLYFFRTSYNDAQVHAYEDDGETDMIDLFGDAMLDLSHHASKEFRRMYCK